MTPPAPESRPAASARPSQAAQASDEDLQQAVLSELHNDRYINDARIQANFKWSAFLQPQGVRVSIERGEATLIGSVGNYRERQAVIDGALEAGAISVDDELSVG